MSDSTAPTHGRAPGPAAGDAGSAVGSAAGRRPAPDGIRAVAVLAVALYHFGGGGTSWLGGGFLGVDVFFVLSGYLITGLLLAEHARTGGIRLGQFWLRRVRRLLPALLLVLLAVSAWTWWAGVPDSYPRRRGDLFWTVAYLANWHAIDVSEDYFAAYAGASPLRHAWSLAVEEQFYLVWPVLLLGLLALGRRWPRLRRLVPVVIAGSVPVSALLMAAEYLPGAPTRAYYGTEGRVQQLMLGALLAWALPRLRGRADRARPRSWAAPGGWAAAGLLALLAGFVLMDDVAAPYYRGGALLAGLAAAALLGGVELAPAGVVARLLSTRPAVALGRISYGVYLWHWPVTVAVPVAGFPLREQVVRQGLRVLLTLVAAAASYRLVERPVLERRWWRPARRLVPAAVLATAAVTAAGVQATALPAGLAEQLAVSSDHPCPGEQKDLLVACLRPSGARLAAGGSPSARPGEPSSAPASGDSAARPAAARPALAGHPLVLAGDSVARSLQPGLDAWARGHGVTWVEAAWKQCTAAGLQLVPPGTGVPDLTGTVCHDQTVPLLQQVLAELRDPVVLVAELTPSIRAVRTGSGQVLVPGTPEHAAALRAGYLRLVDQVAAAGGQVVFVELPPAGRSLGSVLARGRPAAHARSAPARGTEQVVDDAFRAVAAQRPQVAAVVSVTDLVCPGGSCPPLLDGRLVRTDGVHYARGFAEHLVPLLLQRVEAVVQPSSRPR